MDNHAGKIIPWIAGMMDADGCIGLFSRGDTGKRKGKRVNYTPTMHIVTTCQKTVDFLHDAYQSLDIGHHISKSHSRQGNHAACWGVTATGILRTRKLLSIIRPYLVTKALEADVLQAFIDYRTSVPSTTRYGTFEHKCFAMLKALKMTRDVIKSPETIRQALYEGEDIVRPTTKVVELDRNDLAAACNRQ